MNLNKIILEHSTTKKGTYGINHCQNGLIFFKDNIKYLGNDQNFFRKINFNYSQVVMIDKENETSYYEFDKDLYSNTLYDTLYFNGKYWNKRKKWFKILKKNMIENYEMMSLNSSKSKKFFADRVEEINGSIKVTRNPDILEEVYKYIKNIDKYCFRAYISNGDLTDTNICLNNKICDTECFGYNIIICDLAIFFVSLIYGRWIYPKYNYRAYKFRKNKIINTVFKINKRQEDILKRILNLIKPVEFETFKKMIIMRLITPIGLDKMEEKDKLIVDELIRIVDISNIDNLIKNITKYSRGI